MFDPREKIALFIDGANLYATSRALGFDIDYRKLLSSFQKRGYLLRAYYYTALGRGPGIFLDPPADRLARLQRLQGRDQAGQGVHRLRPDGARSRATWTSSSPIDALELAERRRPLRHLLRRRRFPHAGGSAAAARPQGQHRLDHGVAAADDFRRPAPPGRPFHRPDVAEGRNRPRSRHERPAARETADAVDL